MSKTQENLMAAFAGESQARNMYTFFAKVARKEGYHYIAKIFEETALNEMRHAKDHLLLWHCRFGQCHLIPPLFDLQDDLGVGQEKGLGR